MFKRSKNEVEVPDWYWVGMGWDGMEWGGVGWGGLGWVGTFNYKYINIKYTCCIDIDELATFS